MAADEGQSFNENIPQAVAESLEVIHVCDGYVLKCTGRVEGQVAESG
jgi:hypothetical protein